MMVGIGRASLFAIFLCVAVVRSAAAETAAVDVYVARAIAAYEERRYEDALAETAEARAIDPENVAALFYTGLANAALGRLDEAANALETAHRRSPDDVGIRFQLGVVEYHRGRLEPAEALLEELFRAGAPLDGLNVYVGVIRHRRGDSRSALEALERSQPTDPDLRQLGAFYASLSLLRLGLAERAAEEAERALGLQPQSALAGATRQLRDRAAEAGKRGRRFRAEIRVGGFYDDNVAVTPELSDDLTVQAIREQSEDEASPGASTSLRMDYAFLRHAPFEATARYSFYSTTNTDLPRFDIMDNLAGIGGVWRGTMAARPVEAGLDYAYEHILLGLDEFLQRHTIAPFASIVENERNRSYVQTRFQHKDFEEPSGIADDDRRDGENFLAGWLHFTSLIDERLFAKLGYQWDLDDTDGRNFDYAGHRVLAGLQGKLPIGDLWWSYDFDVHLRDYSNRNTTLPVDAPNTQERFDTEYNHVLWLSHPLRHDLAIGLVGQRTDARSNLDAFRFQRNVVAVELTWSY